MKKKTESSIISRPILVILSISFKHSDLDIFMKSMKTPYQQDSSKSKDDNSKEIQRNRRKSARTPKMSAKLLQYLTEYPDTQESLTSPDSNTQ